MLSSGPKLVGSAEGVERVHRSGKCVFAQGYKESLVDRCPQSVSVRRTRLDYGAPVSLQRL